MRVALVAVSMAIAGAVLILVSFAGDARVAGLTPRRRGILRGVGIGLLVIATFAPPLVVVLVGGA